MNQERVQKLLKKIQKHDSQKAFRELYALCYTRFFRIAIYYLHRDEWAQEVVLDIFSSIWENRKKQLIPDHFENYSYILVKNAALNYLEKEQRKETLPIDSIPEKESTYSSPEEIFLNEELFNIYLQGIDELPNRCREVFLLIREEKMTYAQVAEQLQISPKTVDAQLQKALSKLKEKINHYFSELE